MVAVELCNWERKNHNVEKLNTILKFPIIVGSATSAPTPALYAELIKIIKK